MKISEIWIYPIKSLGGISLQEARVLGKGLENDRRFMLVDSDNCFLTQREHPQLALFKLSIHNDVFRVTHHGENINIPMQPKRTEDAQAVKIWDDTVQAFELGNNYNTWFSERTGIPCKLVYFPEDSIRAVDKGFAKNNEQVSLADGYPFLVVGKASLNDLNSKLEKPVPMNRFRPNFVFDGGEPFVEDDWGKITIGSSQFVGLKRCARCVLTTIDQDTGIKGIEPLSTLASYRKTGSKVNFGQNLVVIKEDVVKVGDKILVESFQS